MRDATYACPHEGCCYESAHSYLALQDHSAAMRSAAIRHCAVRHGCSNEHPEAWDVLPPLERIEQATQAPGESRFDRVCLFCHKPFDSRWRNGRREARVCSGECEDARTAWRSRKYWREAKARRIEQATQAPGELR